MKSASSAAVIDTDVGVNRADTRQPTGSVPTMPGGSRWYGHLSAWLFSLMVILILGLGWRNREFHYLTAETGPGYLLGILGGSLMLILLLYPLRKRLRFMRYLGPVKYWFRSHMMLGIIGPSCILFHANFQLGSLNSNVALICMLAVALSGVIGRFIYSKIHNGLYGQKTSLQQLQQQKTASEGRLAVCFKLIPDLHKALNRYESGILNPSRSLLLKVIHSSTLKLRSYLLFVRLRHRLYRALKKQAGKQRMTRHEFRKHYRELRRYLRTYFATLQRIASLGFYERVFSLWHVLHMPLFIMMVITGIVHVIAVHMY